MARDILVGKQLDGYVVKRRIGDGGMGIVYEGEHPVIGRKVAIKILRPELTEGLQARDLIAEARAASAIRHRGIIDVFGFGTLPGVGQYLVMEFLEGTPLNRVIAQRAPMAETEVIALLDELLSALSAAHAAGVIHRDLKPGNIFLEKDSSGADCIKVLDFGLAKRSEVPHGSTPQTRASLIVGTPEYIAPEQANGQPVGPHTDLYAVGLIAFEMLTRRLPFEGASPMALVIQHVQKEPPAPASFVDMHPGLNDWVLRLLAKEPSQRPASAEAARRELKSILRELSPGELDSSPSLSSRSNLSSAAGRAPASQGDAATLKRPTPRTPMTGPRPDFSPASGAQASQAAPAPVVDSPPQPGRRAGLGAAAVVALIVLAGLSGWMMRGRASPKHLPPAVADAPAVPVPAAPVPSPPQAHPAPASPPVTATPSNAPPPPSTAATPPAAQPEPPVAAQPPASESPRPLRTGTLHLNMKGFGRIFLDGKLAGHVPPNNVLTVAEGTHELEIKNPKAQPYRTTITITAEQTLRHTVILKRRTGKSQTP